MDYNADIPFHTPQPAGFYDTNQERAREIAEKRDLSNALLEQLEGKRRIEIEEEERKKDFKKQKLKKESDQVAPSKLLDTLGDPNQVTARRK
jgi:pre-mRNA-splicing factor CDC5/CEF1